jgi:hypothetical protein
MVAFRNHKHIPTYDRELKPLLADLQRAGYPVQSLFELRRMDKGYASAVPILIRHLQAVSDDELREDIVRTLSVPWAKPQATKPLVHAFVNCTNELLRWAIGNALEVVADDSIAEELFRIALDRRFGRSREMVVLALSKLAHPHAKEVARQLLEDEEVVGHALIALRRLRDALSRDKTFELTQHPKAWVRSEARKTLASIDRLAREPAASRRRSRSQRMK